MKKQIKFKPDEMVINEHTSNDPIPVDILKSNIWKDPKLKKKRYNHKELKWISIHNIDVINKFLKEGWTLTYINYLDRDGRVVKPGFYSEDIIVRFKKEMVPGP